jgi:hypothetical protein
MLSRDQRLKLGVRLFSEFDKLIVYHVIGFIADHNFSFGLVVIEVAY